MDEESDTEETTNCIERPANEPQIHIHHPSCLKYRSRHVFFFLRKNVRNYEFTEGFCHFFGTKVDSDKVRKLRIF